MQKAPDDQEKVLNFEELSPTVDNFRAFAHQLLTLNHFIAQRDYVREARKKMRKPVDLSLECVFTKPYEAARAEITGGAIQDAVEGRSVPNAAMLRGMAYDLGWAEDVRESFVRWASQALDLSRASDFGTAYAIGNGPRSAIENMSWNDIRKTSAFGAAMADMLEQRIIVKKAKHRQYVLRSETDSPDEAQYVTPLDLHSLGISENGPLYKLILGEPTGPTSSKRVLNILNTVLSRVKASPTERQAVLGAFDEAINAAQATTNVNVAEFSEQAPQRKRG